MDVVAIGIASAYALFFGAALLGGRARSGRPFVAVQVASVLAGVVSAGAAFAPLVFKGLALPRLTSAWGIAGFATAALAISFLRRGRNVGKAFSTQGWFSWSGGQSVAPAPPAEGFKYPAGGLLLIPVVFLQLGLATAPITVSVGGFAQLPILAVAVAVTVHSVVLGVLSRLCYQSLFTTAA